MTNVRPYNIVKIIVPLSRFLMMVFGKIRRKKNSSVSFNRVI